MNLTLNGIEAMRDKAGEVRIKSQLKESNELLVSVTDTGEGYPSEKPTKSLTHFLPPSGRGQAWAWRSRAPLLSRMVAGSGLPRTLGQGQRFGLLSRNESLRICDRCSMHRQSDS